MKPKGNLFSDGGGDFRLYIVDEQTSILTPVAEQPGFVDNVTATRWLRSHGGREDLLGQTVIVMRGIAIIKIEMAPSLLFKPRAKVAPQRQSPKQAPAPEHAAAT